MSNIVGIDRMSLQQVEQEVQAGAKFVMFQYCISIVLMTFKRPSSIYFVRVDDSVVSKSLGFSALTFLLGWWGIPWGPIYTVGSLVTNIRGGKDVTAEVMAHLRS